VTRRAGTVAAWVATRAVLATALAWGYPSRGPLLGDVHRYADWAEVLAAGHWPRGDPTWQYPPGAAGVLLLPHWLGGLGLSYHAWFVTLMLVCDLAVFAVLRRRTADGAAAWVAGGLLLGPLVLHRFDLAPTAFAILGLAAVAARADGRAGALLGAGALIKAWPAALAVVVPLRRLPRVLAGSVAVFAVAAASLAATGQLGPSMDFTHQQRSRGLEIESVAALPWMVARWVRGNHTKPATTFGSYEVHGDLVHGVAVLCSVLSALVLLVAVIGMVGGWAGRNPWAYSVAVVLLLMLTARVLSPQYVVWPLGLAGFAVRRSRQGPGAGGRLTAWLLVCACAATQLEYPLAFSPVTKAETAGVLILLVRNALLLAAAASAVRDALTRPPAEAG
jgi:hypothetical protein